MPKRSPQDALRVAVCAESDDEAKRLMSYVATRGWHYVGRDYRVADMSRLIADAQKQEFNAVCASLHGLWWLAQVAPAPPVENKPDANNAAPKSTEEVRPDGTRVIHTQVKSTSGVPVDIAIPLKPMTPQLREELAHLLAEIMIKDLREHPSLPVEAAPLQPPSEPAPRTTPRRTKRR